jgi:hypothetical protein
LESSPPDCHSWSDRSFERPPALSRLGEIIRRSTSGNNVIPTAAHRRAKRAGARSGGTLSLSALSRFSSSVVSSAHDQTCWKRKPHSPSAARLGTSMSH